MLPASRVLSTTTAARNLAGELVEDSVGDLAAGLAARVVTEGPEGKVARASAARVVPADLADPAVVDPAARADVDLAAASADEEAPIPAAAGLTGREDLVRRAVRAVVPALATAAGRDGT